MRTPASGQSILMIFCRSLALSLFLAFSLATAQAVSAQTNLEKTTVTYRKVEGHEILADIFRPKDRQLRPVIVYIHGGALIMGNRELDSPRAREYWTRHPEIPYFDVLEFAHCCPTEFKGS